VRYWGRIIRGPKKEVREDYIVSPTKYLGQSGGYKNGGVLYIRFFIGAILREKDAEDEPYRRFGPTVETLVD
jgi:hypothetical protein